MIVSTFSRNKTKQNTAKIEKSKRKKFQISNDITISSARKKNKFRLQLYIIGFACCFFYFFKRNLFYPNYVKRR